MVSYLVVVAISTLAVLVVQALPAGYTNIDISRDQTVSITDETREVLSELDRDITIYLVAEEGSEDEYLTVLLGNYEAASGHISVEQRDPAFYPSFASQYTSEQLSDGSLILVSGEDYRIVDASDLYSLNMSTYSYDFAGEEAITNAIIALTSEDLPKVYLLEGHGEQSLPSSAQSDVEAANYETAQLNLLSEGSVPDDADVVVIYAPSSDLMAEEEEALLDYLEGGGSLLLVTDYDDADMPYLDDLMDTYGVEAVEGLVVEGDPSMQLAGYPYYLLPTVESHEITEGLSGIGTYVLLPLAHGIAEIDQYRSSLTIEPLLSTSSSAYVKTDVANAGTLEYEEGDVSGQTMLGVAITEQVDDENETRVVWYSTSYLLDDSTDLRVGGNNSTLFLNSLAWLSGSEAAAASIGGKGLGTSTLTMNSSVSSTLSVFAVGVIPAVVLFIGFSIWRQRRVR